MKRIISILAIVCSCIFISSCYEDGSTSNDTLAESVSRSNRILEANGSWGDMLLENIILGSSLDIYEASEKEVSMFLYFHYEEVEFGISVPPIPLSGVRYNVKFDYSGIAPEVYLNGSKFTDVPCAVKGWMKRKDSSQTVSNSRTSPADIYYSCDITIDCDIDGKKLHLQIMSITPN